MKKPVWLLSTTLPAAAGKPDPPKAAEVVIPVLVATAHEKDMTVELRAVGMVQLQALGTPHGAQ
jgi:hypothetical protein